jgi:glycosyltransferase involved in cell wall biosynthesis
MAVKIVYDYQIFSVQKYGGISRYFHEISPRIAKMPDRDVRIVSPFYINEYFDKDSSSYNLMRGIKRNKKIGNHRTDKLRDLINQKVSNLIIPSYNPDIIHETYYTTKSIGSKKQKRVITVYDMIYEKFSSSIDPTNKLSQIKAKAIDRADHVICISESTRRDLIEIFGTDEKKVSTIHLAYTPNDNFDGAIQRIPQIEKPYLLYVGQRSSYKNFDRLLEVYHNSQKLKQDFQLVCFGGDKFSSAEIKKNQAFQLQDKVIHISGDDNILAYLYHQAVAFIYPSLYEGFGIPPLEAMSFGCPVICSNVSSIPEIVGDAGEYFDPYDLDSISHAIEKVVYSDTITSNLKRLGYERVKLFSWDLCAEQTSEIYRSLIF